MSVSVLLQIYSTLWEVSLLSQYTSTTVIAKHRQQSTEQHCIVDIHWRYIIYVRLFYSAECIWTDPCTSGLTATDLMPDFNKH